MELINDFKLFISSQKLGVNGRENMRSYFGSYLNKKRKIIEKVNLFGDQLISYKIK